MTNILHFNDTFASPLGVDDTAALFEVISFRKNLPDGPKTPEWIDRQATRMCAILQGDQTHQEIIGTFKDSELIAIVEMAYGKSIPFWFNPHLEAKYNSSKALNGNLIHNGIAVALNLACTRAEERNYFIWYWLRTVRETNLFNRMLARTGFEDNNFEKGGEVAANLGRLYDWAVRTILKARISKDPAMIREVYDVLLPVNDAWHTLLTDHVPA